MSREYLPVDSLYKFRITSEPLISLTYSFSLTLKVRFPLAFLRSNTPIIWSTSYVQSSAETFKIKLALFTEKVLLISSLVNLSFEYIALTVYFPVFKPDTSHIAVLLTISTVLLKIPSIMKLTLPDTPLSKSALIFSISP